MQNASQLNQKFASNVFLYNTWGSSQCYKLNVVFQQLHNSHTAYRFLLYIHFKTKDWWRNCEVKWHLSSYMNCQRGCSFFLLFNYQPIYISSFHHQVYYNVYVSRRKKITTKSYRGLMGEGKVLWCHNFLRKLYLIRNYNKEKKMTWESSR